MIETKSKIMLLSSKSSKKVRVATSSLARNTTQILLATILIQSLSKIETTFNQLVGGSKSFKVTPQILVDASNLKESTIWDPSSQYKQTSVSTSLRLKRATRNVAPQKQQLVDACQSRTEILTPYCATNSKGKLRTIVNSELMQQAIQIETCTRSAPAKCNAPLECGCEQKYKWHRLLVLDPLEPGAARGLFMDWFLFPSSCVCRCRASAGRQLLHSLSKNR